MQKLTQFLQWIQKEKKTTITKQLIKILVAKEDKSDYSNEIYVQIVKAFCTSRLFDEL